MIGQSFPHIPGGALRVDDQPGCGAALGDFGRVGVGQSLFWQVAVGDGAGVPAFHGVLAHAVPGFLFELEPEISRRSPA